jgi:phosphoenolpyruvate synthase/pyruvate phosphate dikinase
MAEGNGSGVAHGTLVAGDPRRGKLVTVESVDDVLVLMRSAELEGLIVFTEQASVTNLAPIMARVGGVVSSMGGPTSHLAIVSRGFETTCVVSAEFEVPVESLRDEIVEIREDGSIHRVQS